MHFTLRKKCVIIKKNFSGGIMLKDERRDAAKDYLFEAILSLETIEDCYNFFEDLCTIKELEEMAKRMCGAKMLDTCKVA